MGHGPVVIPSKHSANHARSTPALSVDFEDIEDFSSDAILGHGSIEAPSYDFESHHPHSTTHRHFGAIPTPPSHHFQNKAKVRQVAEDDIAEDDMSIDASEDTQDADSLPDNIGNDDMASIDDSSPNDDSLGGSAADTESSATSQKKHGKSDKNHGKKHDKGHSKKKGKDKKAPQLTEDETEGASEDADIPVDTESSSDILGEADMASDILDNGSVENSLEDATEDPTSSAISHKKHEKGDKKSHGKKKHGKKHSKGDGKDKKVRQIAEDCVGCYGFPFGNHMGHGPVVLPTPTAHQPHHSGHKSGHSYAKKNKSKHVRQVAGAIEALEGFVGDLFDVGMNNLQNGNENSHPQTPGAPIQIGQIEI
ncbi:hypothetical protein EC988_001978 [Linderina pennispora]|nr:hypothetical protein EC988_001978 [Linderina pennispora]